MDICLDSNVFSSDPNFLEWMRKRDVKGYLSPLAFMELSYYEMKRVGGSMVRFLGILNGLDIEIISFDKGQALIAAKNAQQRHDFSENAVDYGIGAYAYKREIPLVTNNKKHFQWVGEVYTPAEFMKKQ
ncbi:MAG TPA: type II toxin-antitoxin system VapC family toxin [Methanocella sp.]|uniref:type II toxin-antitoxin system VapC family toxin n=1 Tax=Methanocella sp. TaxID=2052833 RepID=UPI002CC151B0|nr:type II toxin-antitoxin system VapC family toxin [Methanocella sp.]HTY91191.1 type II toxin-antitoxin system VapC family toxin [Methanocella sp.]